MLVTKQPVFKRFWYPVIPVAELSGEPKPFVLLGQPIALWLDSEGQPAAVEDRCCHRTAKLSLGKVVSGNISCAYHGWTFNSSGTCVSVPQQPNGSISGNYKVKSYQACDRYGYVWVCLDEPIAEIPNIPEAADPNYRQIHEFYEPWNCAGLRVMENELDMAHPTFVHTATFGSEEHLTPDVMEFTETEWELHYRSVLGVANPAEQQQNLNIEQAETVRTIDGIWFLPFTVKLRIAYPNGLVHIIVNTMTPIDDATSQMVQFCLRNDTENEAKTSDIIAFDRAVTLEDKRILETTDWDVPLDIAQEQHMLTDKPGIIIRHKIAALLKAHGEVEQTKVS
ncbi:MAG: aromatic ring-hydroxylating dioxygenase subunit alpha [Microcoleus sp. PH2017_29_MFU_D_A]|uniref:aromatic ring-hydroxylating dioxygenase subunit alpha n=1 Tax=unclassified Microcoleus TaxID=2642155 RepID=UPI001DF2FD64|nr:MULTISPECIES: aromatic ring-hydroxylating dioxygenase subunit alpha [unclassified Microcoleus]MCC3417469.1 aromatic ring-hydroxylating dioxygenase subunit alpha [Microcoleus sp. PH2017_07_MST_O_A]MCC3430835.1 aromatic ring-hydroxylating dioxygenase subunit alpha [Microcoleus sp. PH2017_04_SCI_O_A]MCC3510207.1 aromatic ring-hydroxylating dioxygenase subunit alpha [Microcoleus sp. PH2017_17_BER_D_A]TAE11031.1 MAG: aromatic ring-hydroxylating dioxygenase subunit alpha [Oscillatoriales cyanobact